MAEHTVATTSEIPEGEGAVVKAGEREIAVFNVGGTYHAIDNTCLHRGGPLGEGALDGACVVCPWHGWEYDVTTGAVKHAPDRAVACHPVRVDGDAIVVTVA